MLRGLQLLALVLRLVLIVGGRDSCGNRPAVGVVCETPWSI